MGIASGMKEMAQDIASSREERAGKLRETKEEAKQLRGGAQDLIKDFQASRKDTGTQLRRDLALDKVQRKSEATGILREAQGLIRDFETSRKEAGSQLRKGLSMGAVRRRSELRETLTDAQDLIKGFQTSRKGMGFELRKELAQSRSKAKSEVGEIVKNAQDLVKDFHKFCQETGDKLRKDLAQGRADRESEVKEMRSDFRKAQTEVRADLKEAAAAWQGLVSTVQAKRAKEKAEAPVIEEEALVAEEEIPDLEAKLLTVLRERPDGITLATIAIDLGVAPQKLTRLTRSLVEKGKIRKEEKLYFPIVSE